MKKENTIDYQNWVKSKKDKKSSDKYRKIVNQLFFECLNYIEDEFWISKFKKMAYGTFPSGFFFKNHTIYKKKKNKTVSEKISEIPSEAYKEVKNFLHDNGNIYSIKDLELIEQLTKEDEDNQEINKNCEWKNYKTLHKNVLIYNYIDELADKENISKENKNNLLNDIKLGLYLKILTDEDFIVENNFISEIKKLKKDENGNYYFEKEICKMKSKLDAKSSIFYNIYDSDYNLYFFY